jgi:hypothetical protein
MSEVIQKLKLESYRDRLVLHKPNKVQDFNAISFDVEITKPKYDIVFTFIFSLDEFTQTLKTIIDKDLLNPDGFLYFAYPKKGNKEYKQHIGRDDFFCTVSMDSDGYVNDSVLKFAKMLSFNDTFTVIGLKHQAKRKLKSSQPSQCVGDYVNRIPDLQEYFRNKSEILAAYNALTPGYQRDWARYVYSVKSETTVAKRLAEMEDILKQGYKTKDLYRRATK